MNIPLIGVVTAAVTWLLMAGLMIRKSWRIGYLEGQIAAWEERWREHQSIFHGPLSGGPTSMALPLRSFSVASHADIFGSELRPPGDGPAGVWALRDRDRREGRR